MYFVFVKLIASSSNSTTDLNLTFLTSDSLNAWHPILFNVFGNSIFLIPLTNLNASSQTDFTPSLIITFFIFPLYFPASNVILSGIFPLPYIVRTPFLSFHLTLFFLLFCLIFFVALARFAAYTFVGALQALKHDSIIAATNIIVINFDILLLIELPPTRL